MNTGAAGALAAARRAIADAALDTPGALVGLGVSVALAPLLLAARYPLIAWRVAYLVAARGGITGSQWARSGNPVALAV